MIGTHLGGPRETDPLEGWRALAAAVILQAVRDAQERPARCQRRPRKWCYKEGCSRCATKFLQSKEGLALLSLLLGHPCTHQHVRVLLTCSLPLPHNPRKIDATTVTTSPSERGPYRYRRRQEEGY
jgi:hypothetical protein